MRSNWLFIFIAFLPVCGVSQTVIANFSSPDTVCVNTPVNITNTSTGASSYYWNFCVADVNTPPTGVNMGNLGGFSAPVYIDYVFEGGNYYGFLTNNYPGKLLRLNFGNSLLNTPSITDLGTVGGVIPNNTEGVQVEKNEGKWYVLVLGGDPLGSTPVPSAIVKIELGANIANNSPIGTYWGNIGNLAYPHDLYVFDDNGHWYGLTVNTNNSTITRFDFTTSFSNTPTAVNLGNIGTLSSPTGIYALKENGAWYAFVTNASSATLTRLNFGTSLLNPPTGVNLGNIGGQFHNGWDIYIMKYCGQNIGFVINNLSNELIRLDFGSSILNTPTASNYGNIGNLSFPHCLSKIFRVGADLYTFVPNVNNNTLTRIKFTGCTNSSIPNSTAQNPPSIVYNAPGVYNINLTIDDGLATQAAICKQVVVLDPPVIKPLQDTSVCPGSSFILNATVSGGKTFSWAPAAGLSDPNLLNPVVLPTVSTKYTLTASNAPGCSSTGGINITVLSPQQCNISNVVPSFTSPDTVCVNTPVNITNTSTGASSYYWNFCVADVNTPPSGVNMGNIGGKFSAPVYIDYVFENGNYYGFLTNNYPGKLLRLDFGNSLLNTPAVVDLGTVGVIPNNTEGIQVVKNQGKWYVLIVGGDPLGTVPVQSAIVKIELGANIANNTPVGTYWGNIGALAYPHDLYVFDDNGHWYGLTVNTNNSTITKFDFTTSFSNTPSAVNLGNIGTLDAPTGIYALKENGNWYAFVTNAKSATLTRLDFGFSLLNTPTGVNLGNIGGKLQNGWDIYIMKYCGQNLGFVINNLSNELIKLDFGSSILNIPTASSYGNIGSMSFPHCLSKIFRAGADLYTFVPNVNNNTLTRIKFTGCTSSNIPSSTAQDPPPVTYATPGTYNINLSVDEGLPTQSAFCKQVVVLASPAHSPTKQLSICPGGTLKIGSSVQPANYSWNTGSTSDSIVVVTAGTYWVESERYGCSVRDSFIVSIVNLPIDFGFQQSMCSPTTVQFTSDLSGVQSFQWNFGDGQSNNNSQTPVTNYADYGAYNITLKMQYGNGCTDSVVKTINVKNVYDNSVVLNSDTSICLGDSVLLKTMNSIATYCWKSSSGAAPLTLDEFVKPGKQTTYLLTSKVTETNLVVNSDFSSGNAGFISDYNYVSSNNGNGQYWIGNNPNTWNPGLTNCGDHTSGAGNMMMVKGSSAVSSRIWSQTVTVTPNTDYDFSAWVNSLSTLSAAKVRFAINNSGLTIVSAGNSNCQWKQYSTTWNSGNNTSASLSILGNNTIPNDFAVDDIFFGRVTTKTDSFTVNVTGLCDSVKITGPDKVCSASDTISYSIYKAPNCSVQYSLQIDNSFASVISQTATTAKLLFKKNGTTVIKASYADNCKIVVDSARVAVQFSPDKIDLGPDVTTCKDTSIVLNARKGFVSYLWQNGTSDSVLLINGPGLYNVIAQNFCGAQLKDTFRLIKTSPVPFAVAPLTATVCKGDSVNFTASGGTTYLWSPSSNFKTPTASSTKAIINVTQNFNVFISDSVCGRDTAVIIPVIASDGALITISKSNDVNCGNDSAILVATGGVSYVWSPDSYITRKNGDRITVKPYQNTTFTVKGVNGTGCVGQDSITVFFFKEGDQKLFMPTAFTPNGDGLNDVIRPTFIGPSTRYDFRIYNRWGQLVFESKTPGSGWDGTLKGVLQKADVYVFYLTAEGGCNGKFEKKGTFALIR